MKIFETLQDWITFRDLALNRGQEIGFVPTMGALHDGHGALIRESKTQTELTVVSIFVNPTQFNQSDDFEKYPRNPSADIEYLTNLGVDVLLAPKQHEIYKDKNTFKIQESEDSTILCGAFRPGHFVGVLTVMMKLLQLVKPEKCFMGEKDYQQLHLIEKLSESFFLDTKIIGVPTVREPTGLAMSSRNVRLSHEGREKAPLIYKLLKSGRDTQYIREQLEQAGFRVEYVESHWNRTFVAAWLEDVRLIDNV